MTSKPPAVVLQHDIKGSSNIAKLGYDAETKTFNVRFLNGGVYQYSGVPKAVYDAVMAADSKGSALFRLVIGKYEHRRVDE